ncbi:TetR/AcrR family transcriptional regulator [Haloimpatiens sp. FM7315]|uniref:TetR/AcrR family transcriptional regulator n=1 Tax=Haloimpatiens sp. FM7315 TaxID=3298609 RepID=UPI00370BB76B
MDSLKISLPQRKKIKKKQEILKIARAKFQEKGFDNTSVEEISEAALVSKSTFFNYFATKDKLLYEIAEEEILKIQVFIDNDLVKNLKITDKIYKLMEFIVEDTLPFLKLTKKVIESVVLITNRNHSPIVKLQNIVRDLIEKAQEKGEIKKEYEALDIAAIIMGTYFVTFFRWILEERDFTEKHKEKLISFLNMIFKGISI